jgi:hypothetical protein
MRPRSWHARHLACPDPTSSGADFSGADFSGADCSGADCSGLDFSGLDRHQPSWWPIGYPIVRKWHYRATGNTEKEAPGGIIRERSGLATGMTAPQSTMTNAQSTATHPARRPGAAKVAGAVASGGLSSLSGVNTGRVHMLAPRGRNGETNGILTCMTAFDAFLVERLHVDLGHVSSAVCMAG